MPLTANTNKIVISGKQARIIRRFFFNRPNRQHTKQHGFNLIIKYRQQETSRQEKPKQLTPAESKKYKRHRGLIETVFGGAETEYGNKTCFRLKEQRYKDNKLLSLVHNIKTYFRLIAEVKPT